MQKGLNDKTSIIILVLRFKRADRSVSLFYNGQVTNVENNLVDDMEEDYFSISNILQGLRLGKYREELSTDLAYSFSGRITDFNAWSGALSSQDMIAWTNCVGNFNPDLG